jgi:hypothetical protein
MLKLLFLNEYCPFFNVEDFSYTTRRQLIFNFRERSLNMARGGGMEEKLEILKKIWGLPSKIICLFKAPPYAFYTF